MRISDWSSDVCSSDLEPAHDARYHRPRRRHEPPLRRADAAERARPHRLSSRRARALSGHEGARGDRSEEHTSELQSLMRISYAVFCLKKKRPLIHTITTNIYHTRHNHTSTTRT